MKSNLQLKSYYKKRISLRKNRSDLNFGTIEYVVADDKEITLAYCREDKKIDLLLFLILKRVQDFLGLKKSL